MSFAKEAAIKQRKMENKLALATRLRVQADKQILLGLADDEVGLLGKPFWRLWVRHRPFRRMAAVMAAAAAAAAAAAGKERRWCHQSTAVKETHYSRTKRTAQMVAVGG